MCESVETAHSDHRVSRSIMERLGSTIPSLQLDSQCKYGCVARGDAHIFLRIPVKENYEEKIWDHAAGYLLVKEAGGQVTNWFGADLDFTRGRTLPRESFGILASDSRSHAKILDSIKAYMRETGNSKF